MSWAPAGNIKGPPTYAYVSPISPLDPELGMFWYDTIGQRLTMWDGSGWVVTGGGIGEAPSDGNTYGRMSFSWTQVYRTSDVWSKSEADAKYLPFTGGTLTGPLTLQFTSGPVYLRVNKGVGQAAALVGSRTGNVARWAVVVGDETPETGSNNGSDFDIARYNDVGTLIDVPLGINRATGIADFAFTPTAPMPALSDYSAKLANTQWVQDFVALFAAATGAVHVGTSAPASPAPGKLWWHTTEKTLRIWAGGVWEPMFATWGV